ncbi:MAG: nucleotidyltransferase domain-containing protein [Ignavibacterium sp.]|nr:nucleotidyltransferase domain-containing protein [Ignavibacterium sp.]
MASEESLSAGGRARNPYVLFLEDREKKRCQDNLKWREKVWERLIQAIHLVTSQYPLISRIFLFGSLIGEDFNPDSDVDLYIEGLSAEDYFEVKRVLEETLDLQVDLYTQSDRRRFVDRIIQRGVKIYERIEVTICYGVNFGSTKKDRK